MRPTHMQGIIVKTINKQTDINNSLRATLTTHLNMRQLQKQIFHCSQQWVEEMVTRIVLSQLVLSEWRSRFPYTPLLHYTRWLGWPGFYKYWGHGSSDNVPITLFWIFIFCLVISIKISFWFYFYIQTWRSKCLPDTARNVIQNTESFIYLV